LWPFIDSDEDCDSMRIPVSAAAPVVGFLVGCVVTSLYASNRILRFNGSNSLQTSSRSNSRFYCSSTSNSNILQPPVRYELSPGHMVRHKDFYPFWVIVFQSRQVMVNYIPKVMTSSLRMAASQIEKCPDQDPRCYEARISDQAKQTDLTLFTRVLFLRDPLERAVSAYENSRTNSWISLPYCRYQNCSLAQWMQTIADDPRAAFRNEHFKQQSVIAQLDRLHYHYVLRLTSEIDQTFFWDELLHYPRVMAHVRPSTLGNASSSQRVEAMARTIPTETFHLIAALYARDMKLWGEVLERGTPRQDTEYTLYDYYMQFMAT